jgi:two-component system sensor histidine kinase DesK
MRIRLLPTSRLGWTPYAWLIYLSIYIVWGVVSISSVWEGLLQGLALVVFLALYFRAFWERGQRLLIYAFAIVAIGVLVSPFNPGGTVFFIYGAAFLGEAVRPAAAIRWLLVIVGVLAIETWLMSLPPEGWVPGIVFSLLIGGTNIHFGEVQRKDAALLAAHKATQQMAAVAERERIARDLHDLLGHTLSVIVIKSELASKLADRDPVRAAAEIRDVEQISRHALQEVRKAIYGYREARIDQELASGQSVLAAAGVTLVTNVTALDLDAEVERPVALAIREALTNVIRHARATRCDVTVVRDGDDVIVTIADDGVGGDCDEGSGLSGMRARLQEIGGTVARDGTRGTTLTIAVPARRPAPASDLVPS